MRNYEVNFEPIPLLEDINIPGDDTNDENDPHNDKTALDDEGGGEETPAEPEANPHDDDTPMDAEEEPVEETPPTEDGDPHDDESPLDAAGDPPAEPTADPHDDDTPMDTEETPAEEAPVDDEGGDPHDDTEPMDGGQTGEEPEQGGEDDPNLDLGNADGGGDTGSNDPHDDTSPLDAAGDPPDGNDDDGEDGGDEDTGEDDGTVDGEDDQQDETSQQLEDKIKGVENELFDTLTDNEKNNKILKLKEEYFELFKKLTGYETTVSNIEKDSNNVEMFVRIRKTIGDLKEYVYYYILHNFDTVSYFENQMMFYKYISILNSITKILEKYNKNTEKEES